MSIGDQSVLEKEPSESSGVGAASAHISCGGIGGAGSAQMSSFSSSDGTDGAGSAHMSLALVGGGDDGGGDDGGGVVSFGVR